MWNLWYFYVAEILQNDEVIVGKYVFDNIHSYIHDNTREEWQSYMQMLPPSGKLKMRQN